MWGRLKQENEGRVNLWARCWGSIAESQHHRGTKKDLLQSVRPKITFAYRPCPTHCVFHGNIKAWRPADFKCLATKWKNDLGNSNYGGWEVSETQLNGLNCEWQLFFQLITGLIKKNKTKASKPWKPENAQTQRSQNRWIFGVFIL